MKILITESQYENILTGYFNMILEYPEFDFVDRIEVIEGTTKTLRWINTHDTPFYEYIVYLNEDSENIDDLYDRIELAHKMIFPRNDDGTIRAYYHINTKYEL